jgi:ankyrin repeat protein
MNKSKIILLALSFLSGYTGYLPAVYMLINTSRDRLTQQLIAYLAQPDATVYGTSVLLARGALINSNNGATGYTPLMSALANRNISPKIINFLVRWGSMLNARGHLGESPFLLAAQYNPWPSIIQPLLAPNNQGLGQADITANDLEGRTGLGFLLANAVYNRLNPRLYPLILQSIYIVLNSLGTLQTVQQNRVRRALNNRGLYINPDGTQGPSTPLMWLAYLGNAALLQRFLTTFRHIVFINIQDHQGRTAYDWARDNATRGVLLPWGARSGVSNLGVSKVI